LPDHLVSAKYNRMTIRKILAPRSALYLPASNPRAIEKARTLPADMIILDLEDAVKPGLKDEARAAATIAVAQGFGDRLTAIRINGADSPWHDADLVAVLNSACNFVVLPKAESVEAAESVAERAAKPVIAMIETPAGILAAADIAAGFEVAGLIAGTNDLMNMLQIPPDAGRPGLSLSLQMIVLAARRAGIWSFDGVYNQLSDPAGLEAECREGRSFGFDGKTLIHPDQIAIANRIWSPTPAQIADASALVAAASGGAERLGDRMIESMHAEMAKRVLARAEQARPGG
jgi:(3S)-malyl-CoA thioesterase